MRCGACQHENPAVARFCLECGARLAVRCAACAAELPAHAKSCMQCGRALQRPSTSEPAPPGAVTPRHLAEKILTSRAALEGERKQVTILFADIKGSMELLADRDPEQARRLLDEVVMLM